MRRCIAVLLLAFVTLLTIARPAAANPSGDFASLANSSRGSSGLAAYAYAGDLADVALGQAQRMAARHTIFHNPNLANEVSNWCMAGENVGVGASAEGIHNAFMQSPDHRANILSRDFAELGVGSVVGDDGRLYVSEVFRLQCDGPAPEPEPSPAPVADPAPAAEPVVTPEPEPTPAPAPEPAPIVPATVTPPTPAELATAIAPPVYEGPVAVAFTTTAAAHSGIPTVSWIGAAFAVAVLGANAVVIRRRLQDRQAADPRMA